MGWVGWLIESGLVCWLWAASYSSPWLDVTYDQAVVGQFWLMNVYKLCRVRNSFEWSCPRYRTDYGVDLTRRFWVLWLELLSLAMSLLIRWLLSFPELLSLIYLLPLLCIYLIMTYLSITFSLAWWGGTCRVRLYSRVYCCVFLQQWTQTLIPKTTSSRRPHPSCAWRISYLQNVVLES
jgi:hypothetical protein